MTDTNENRKISLENWADLARVGSMEAVVGLSRMVNSDFAIAALDIEEISVRNAFALIGKVDDPVTAIYLLFSGNAHGQILLAFQPQIAFDLVDMAMGLPCGTTHCLGEMERSTLGEMGNIVGTFFLNGVADFVGLRLMPSTPVVVEDMAGVVISSVLSEALEESDSLFVIKLLFSSTTKKIEGRFLVLPAFSN